jgi:hypothetical protein
MRMSRWWVSSTGSLWQPRLQSTSSPASGCTLRSTQLARRRWRCLDTFASWISSSSPSGEFSSTLPLKADTGRIVNVSMRKPLGFRAWVAGSLRVDAGGARPGMPPLAASL